MNLYELCKNSDSRINLTVCISDLLLFGETIAAAAVKEVLERHEEKMYSIDEVAEKFNVSDTTLWRWSKQGLITRKKIGNRIYYPETEIRRLCSIKV